MSITVLYGSDCEEQSSICDARSYCLNLKILGIEYGRNQSWNKEHSRYVSMNRRKYETLIFSHDCYVLKRPIRWKNKFCHITLEVCEIEVLTAIVGHGEWRATSVIGVMARLGSGGLKGYFSAQVDVFGRNPIDTFLGTQAAGVVLEA